MSHLMSLLGVKQTWVCAPHMSAFDPIEGGHFFPEHNPRQTAVELRAFFGA